MAGGADEGAAREALEVLCRQYWYPLYAFVRRQGYSAHEAEDLVQGFFAMLLARQDFAKADPQRGRFRAFLLQALKHHLSHQRERQRAEKRGGDRLHYSLDLARAEGRYLNEPATAGSTETLFDRQWAATLLEHVREGLAAEYAAAGKQAVFHELAPLLTGADSETSYQSLGSRLEMSPGAVKVAVHRLRRRFGERLRQAVAETVSSPEELEAELRELLAALQG